MEEKYGDYTVIWDGVPVRRGTLYKAFREVFELKTDRRRGMQHTIYGKPGYLLALLESASKYLHYRKLYVPHPWYRALKRARRIAPDSMFCIKLRKYERPNTVSEEISEV